MDRILKERYKYTPKERLEVLAASRDESGRAEIELEADARLCRTEAATAAEVGKWLSDNPAERNRIDNDPLLAANLAAPDNQIQGVQIDIPDRFQAKRILYLHLHYPSGEAPGRYILRNTIRAGRDASARIVVYHHPAGGGVPTVIQSLTCIEAAAGAAIEMIETTETGANYFGTTLATLHRDARVKTATIDLDNAFLRRNQFVSLIESGAECHLEGIYIADGIQQVDNYIRMHHAAAHCTSGQLFKGVAADESRAAFTGHIYVAPGAQQTVALQENHNIVLSDRAKADIRPQLEIYADDVQCNHGATIGRLDPEAIYYMRQRGIGLEAAKRLQIEGFIDEIVDRNCTEELAHMLHEKIAARLHHI